MNINEIIKSDIRTSLTRSGLLLFLAGFLIFMGIITGEIFYSTDFSTRDNYINELASEIDEATDFRHVSASVFNYTMLVAGLMIMAGTWFVNKIFKKYLLTIPMVLFGAGLMSFGIFPVQILQTHNIFALVVFICGAMSAIVSFKIVNTPLRYIFGCFGIIVLTFLIFQKFFIQMLGVGGAERWLFYPVVFWITGMGAYLLGIKDGHRNTLAI